MLPELVGRLVQVAHPQLPVLPVQLAIVRRADVVVAEAELQLRQAPLVVLVEPEATAAEAEGVAELE